MAEDRKVKIKSGVKGRVGVNLPDLRFKRIWPKMDSSIEVDYKILEEALFDDGFARMIKDGVLIIDDEKAKIDLGLITEGAERRVAKITLNEMQMLKLLKVDSFDDFKTTVDKMSRAQVETLCDLAIEKNVYDFDKTDYLKGKVGIDIRRTIELNRQDKQDITQTNNAPVPGQNNSVPPFIKK